MRVVGLVMLLLPSSAFAQELLVNPGFETVEAICGYPGATGDWGVDGASVVTAEAGVTPVEGVQMTRLEFPFFAGSGASCVGVASGGSADVAQLVGVASCHPAGNDARLRMTAAFARSATGGVDMFTCTLRAYAGAPSSFASATPLATSSSTRAPVAAGAWVTCATELTLPPTATYVAAYVSGRVAAGSREVYVDDASVTVVDGRCGFDCTAAGAMCPDPASPPNATTCDLATGLCVPPLVLDAGVPDAGSRDGGPVRDGGIARDGGPVRDGGGPNDGGNRDAGPDRDGGSERDAGLARDSGSDRDGGSERDAGAIDAGAIDAGSDRDAGARDAGGVASARDAGDTMLETEDEGCSCAATTARRGRPSLAWLVLLVSLHRRRSRRCPS
ncbi:MAG: hypothetical protein RIT81_24920 [Deltaproteobacteria bacterium]